MHRKGYFQTCQVPEVPFTRIFKPPKSSSLLQKEKLQGQPHTTSMNQRLLGTTVPWSSETTLQVATPPFLVTNQRTPRYFCTAQYNPLDYPTVANPPRSRCSTLPLQLALITEEAGHFWGRYEDHRTRLAHRLEIKTMMMFPSLRQHDRLIKSHVLRIQ